MWANVCGGEGFVKTVCEELVDARKGGSNVNITSNVLCGPYRWVFFSCLYPDDSPATWPFKPERSQAVVQLPRNFPEKHHLGLFSSSCTQDRWEGDACCCFCFSHNSCQKSGVRESQRLWMSWRVLRVTSTLIHIKYLVWHNPAGKVFFAFLRPDESRKISVCACALVLHILRNHVRCEFDMSSYSVHVACFLFAFLDYLRINLIVGFLKIAKRFDGKWEFMLYYKFCQPWPVVFAFSCPFDMFLLFTRQGIMWWVVLEQLLVTPLGSPTVSVVVKKEISWRAMCLQIACTCIAVSQTYIKH